jgi:hypothetical protein
MSGIHQTEIDLHSDLDVYTKAILGCQDEHFVLICAEVVAVVVVVMVVVVVVMVVVVMVVMVVVVVVVVADLAAMVVVAFDHPAAFDFVFDF